MEAIETRPSLPYKLKLMLPENWLVLTIAGGFISLISYIWFGRDKKLAETNNKIDNLLLEVRSVNAAQMVNANEINRLSSSAEMNARTIADLVTKVAVLSSELEQIKERHES